MLFIVAKMGYFPVARPAINVGAGWLFLLWIADITWVKPKQNTVKVEQQDLPNNLERES